MFDILFSPWRYEYIKSFTKPEKTEKCLFCELWSLPEHMHEKSYVLYKGREALIVLNIYPYNTGHLMIAPKRHVASIEYLEDHELYYVNLLLKVSVKALRRAYNPDGFNIGINIGRAAGAGVEDHVHIHVVPRWYGDANFMPILSGTKVLPQSLDDTYKLLKPLIIDEIRKIGL